MAVLVHDIREASLNQPIVEQMKQMLNPAQDTQKKFPTLLLYDEKGLKLYEELTYLEEYYPLASEFDALSRHADALVKDVPADSILLELGSGNLRKVKILLDAFERAQKPASYYALDLSLPELHRTLGAIEGQYTYVRCAGLLGTYEDGTSWLRAEDQATAKCILWLGSSIGNYERAEAADFLRTFSRPLSHRDLMIVGLDACQDDEKVFRAYNDSLGTTHRFILNGLDHANRLLGKQIFDKKHWKVVGHYDKKNSRHQAFLCSDINLATADFNIAAGERVQIEESNKYSRRQSQDLWRASGLVPREVYPNTEDNYHLHVLQKSSTTFPSKPEEYAAKPVPSLKEFEQLWLAWDQVSQGMLPKKELLSKPIKLRNACIFYLGHLPAFLDIHLTRASEGQPTSPAFYHRIFERGIDPDVENPELCHAHSEIPDEWPPLSDILVYQEKVRNRVKSFYNPDGDVESRKIGRALWLAFEHEAMHLETFLYMLLQSNKSLPPDNHRPNFEALALRAQEHRGHDDWVKIPEAHLVRGLDDEENDEGPDRYFGWDNEQPKRPIVVPSFESRPKPLTNGDYAAFLEGTGKAEVPASWIARTSNEEVGHAKVTNGTHQKSNGSHVNGASPFLDDKYVRSFYGPVPLRLALDWPVMASYDELASCARYFGGRIPTAKEVESIYHHAADLKSNETDSSILARKISAVNGHLSNNGVEISPPSKKDAGSSANSAGPHLSPHELFVDLEGCNTGFKNFHPLPVHLNGSHLSGRGDLGGVWEFTSTVLERHENFKPGQLYPAYTADFFDGKHNVVLGGSFATHPRIAGRKTFINWYQHNYPYAFVGARIVRDIQSHV